MSEDFQQLVAHSKTSGDLAVILIFGGLGFTLDTALNIVGFFSPGYAGVVSASTALGIKKSIDAARTTHDANIAKHQEEQRRHALERAAQAEIERERVNAESREREIQHDEVRALRDLEGAIESLFEQLESRGRHSEVERLRTYVDLFNASLIDRAMLSQRIVGIVDSMDFDPPS